MIIYDFMGHMVSTESAQELHKFAEQLGMPRGCHLNPGYRERHPHYDLTTPRMQAKARRMGAVKVTPTELAKTAWWAETSRIENQGGA